MQGGNLIAQPVGSLPLGKTWQKVDKHEGNGAEWKERNHLFFSRLQQDSREPFYMFQAW